MDPTLSTADSVSPSPQTPTTHEKYYKVKRSGQKRKLALGRRLLYNNVHSEGLDVFPRETMENIINRIDNVDSVCLALTNTRNHAMVIDITKQRLSELVPRTSTGYLYLRKGHSWDEYRPRHAYLRSSFSHLMRRLVLWMPREDMLCNLINDNCSRNWRSNPGIATLLEGRYKAWERRVSEDIEWAQGKIEGAIERIDTRRGQLSLKVEVEVKEGKVDHQAVEHLTAMPQALGASVLDHEDMEDATTCPSITERILVISEWLNRMQRFGYFNNVYSTETGAEGTLTTNPQVGRSIWHGSR